MSALEQLHRELLQQESLVALQRQVSAAAGKEVKNQASSKQASNNSTSGSKQASNSSTSGGRSTDVLTPWSRAGICSTTLASNSSWLSSLEPGQ